MKIPFKMTEKLPHTPCDGLEIWACIVLHSMTKYVTKY